MQVNVQIKNVYGESKAYPTNLYAQSFAAIAGTKTLTKTTLLQVLFMGIPVVEVDRNGRTVATYTEVNQLPSVA